MPVQQLEGGGLGNALGMVGGFLAANAGANKQRKDAAAKAATATADKQHTTAREDAAAADTHANIQSLIHDRDVGQQNVTANNQNAQNALGAYNTYFPMLSNPPTKPGDPPLHGPALGKALQNIRIEAMNKGAFSDEKTAQQRQTDFNTEIARILQEDKAASTQSFLGKEAKTAIPGDPQQMLNFLLKHRLPAERAAGIDTKDTMAMITDAQRQVNEANLEKQRGVQNQNAGQRIQISLARGAGGGGGYNSDLQPRAQAIESKALGEKDVKSALRDVETANLPRRDRAEVRQDVMDQFRAPPMSHDTSGLSAGGKQMFDNDVRNYMTKDGDASGLPDPDPSDPKYQKKTAALGGGAPAGGGGSAPGGGGEKRTVSLKAAMALPGNKGKTPQQVQADITAHGYSVAP